MQGIAEKKNEENVKIFLKYDMKVLGKCLSYLDD